MKIKIGFILILILFSSLSVSAKCLDSSFYVAPYKFLKVKKILDCTEATSDFLNGRREGKCRVLFSDKTRGDVERPIAVEDTVIRDRNGNLCREGNIP